MSNEDLFAIRFENIIKPHQYISFYDLCGPPLSRIFISLEFLRALIRTVIAT